MPTIDIPTPDGSWVLDEASAGVLGEVAAERASHASRGYDNAHDDQHTVHDLAWRAVDYATRGDRREDFVRAAAVLVAAIERHDREEAETR